jgi:radical SAM superfamily enzyme YgiQ (UPF0313 family)
MAGKNGKMEVCLITPHKGEMGVRSLSASLRADGARTKLVLAPLFEQSVYTENQVRDLEELARGSDVIGVSSMGISHKRTVQLLEAIKNDPRLREKFLIVGGATATQYPEAFNGIADAICRGEGEQTMVELVRTLNAGGDVHKMRNLAFTAKGKLVQNPVRMPVYDMDTLPFDDYDFHEGHHYRLTPSGMIRITTPEQSIPGIQNLATPYAASLFVFGMRGCAYACTFCINSWEKSTYRKEHKRARSAENLIAHIKRVLKSHPHVEHVSMFDDDFFLRPLGEMQRFSALYREQVGLPFFTYASPTTFDEEKLGVLMEAGLARVAVGFQTGSARMLRIYHRPVSDIEKAPGILAVLAKAQAENPNFELPDIDFMIDAPLEKAADARATVEMMLRISAEGPLEAHMHNFHMFPGTPFYESAKREGLPVDDMLARDTLHMGYEFQDHRPKIDEKLAVIASASDPEQVLHAFYTTILFFVTGRCDKERLGVLPRQEITEMLAMPIEKVRGVVDSLRKRAEQISTVKYYTELEKTGGTTYLENP